MSAGVLALGLAVLPWPRPEAPPPSPPAPRIVLALASFGELEGWGADRQGAALGALIRSCAKLAEVGDTEPVGADGIGGLAGDWRAPCAEAGSVPAGDDEAARRFFEASFEPYAVTDNGVAEGLFTGYHEPELRASRTRQGAYRIPLHGRPDDLVTVDLGRFETELRGRTIAGRVRSGALDPYEARAEIIAGTLQGRAPVLFWLADPVAAFFLHIQGSGRLVMEGVEVVRVGFAAKNGRPYYAIGRELVRRGALAREAVSARSIQDWLRANPGEAEAVMALNASYVFFRVLEGEGPLGAGGVALTPGRSLAVDRRYLFMGAPIWLEATMPGPEGAGAEQPLRRLLIAQDTGGAIRGPVRGDVFFGSGEEAEARAGAMRHRGRYFLFLPRAAAQRRARSG